jgi:spore coat protein A
MSRNVALALVLPAVVVLHGQARADELTLVSVKDNTLFSESEDLSNGSGSYFFAGETNGETLRRGLVMFDVAGAVPAGSMITSVSLQLHMSRTEVGNEAVSIHRVLTDWGEGASDASGQEGAGDDAEDGDATWLYTFYDTSDPGSSPQWGTPGGDYVNTASATASVGNEGFYTWGSTAATVSDAQLMLDNPGTNYGWIVIGTEGQGQSAKRFDARENNNSDRWPRLTVVFDPPAVDGACCFPDGTCQVLSASDCINQGGAFQGTGTDCGGVKCPVIVGACCFDDGTCLELTSDDCATQSGLYQGDASVCSPDLCPLVLEPFVDALPIPGVAQPVMGEPGGEATYEIEMTQFQQQLHRDLAPTTVWGYEGAYPGPTIEAFRDLPVTVEWINALPATHYLPVDTCPHGADDDTSRTVVHLHGGHVPANVDGYPEDWFPTGFSDTYVYPNNQPPATLWFHDHALGITRLNVYMGLAAFYLLRDDAELALDLPTGEFEIPIVIQDRSFNPDGSLKYPHPWQDSFFGDKILVNGKVWPYLDVKQARYRFRILDGSNSRTYVLTLSNGAPFHLIGTDGGLLESPLAVNELTLAPGERADVIVDFTNEAPGTEIFMINSAPAPFPGDPGVGVVPDVMKFVVSAETGDTPQIPATLVPVDELEEEDSVRTRDFALRKLQGGCGGFKWLINDLGWDDITEYPRLGHTEIWRFINHSGMIHPMHVHLVLVQVLDRQDFELIDGEVVPIGDPMGPDPTEVGWKDTVRTNPQQITRVIMRFEDYEGLYPYHCHFLEHEDHEMMRQFETQPPCPWDLDYDDVVSTADLLALLSAWNSDPGGPPDFNGDGTVGTSDLLELLSNWGPCP